MFTEGGVIHVQGTLDMKRGEPQIIVDAATDRFEFVVVEGAQADEDDFRPIMAGTPEPRPAPVFVPPPPDLPEYVGDDAYVADSSQEPEWPPDDEGVSATQVTSLPGDAPSQPLMRPTMPVPAELMFEHERRAQAARMITIRFWRNGDTTRDRMRLERLIGALREIPGHDQFEIGVATPDSDEVHWLDFDFTTCWGPDLETRLARVSGVEVVHVGEIAAG
jgi:hypothetical protein